MAFPSVVCVYKANPTVYLGYTRRLLLQLCNPRAAVTQVFSAPTPAIARAARYLPWLRLCTCLWSTAPRDFEPAAPTVKPVNS
jgi:hypothetical protein